MALQPRCKNAFAGTCRLEDQFLSRDEGSSAFSKPLLSGMFADVQLLQKGQLGLVKALFSAEDFALEGSSLNCGELWQSLWIQGNQPFLCSFRRIDMPEKHNCTGKSGSERCQDSINCW